VVDVRLVTCATLPVPDPDTSLLATALRRRGVRVAIDDWRDPAVDWAAAAVTVVRSPWDYTDSYDAFVAWIRATGAQTDLWNPPALLEWNVHKSYLLDLHGHGAPVVPTVVMLGGSAASLDGICDARGWNTVVVKPAVAVGAAGAAVFDVGDPAGQEHLDALLEHGDVLVQPFVSSVATTGELAVIVFDGEVSHAVQKVPGAGDFRVHEEWGGSSGVVPVPDAAAELALRVCAALPVAPLYARVDLLQLQGMWHVSEVEATEPSLWLDHAPAEAVERFAEAVIARLP
jgi:glutathione synthase/RimK-type ligase-like ATP-grasp enzyme